MDCQWSPVNWICLLANTSEGNLHRNKFLICVPKETKGVSVAKQINKIGYFCSDTAQLFFEDVVIPKSYIIGEEGKGFTYQIMQFQEERMWATVQGRLHEYLLASVHLQSIKQHSIFEFLAVLMPFERCIRQTVEYTCDCKTFGWSVLDNQVVHCRLAELESEVEALRSLVYRTVGKYMNYCVL